MARAQGTAEHRTEAPGTRTVLARTFTWAEDVIYIGLGVLLSAAAFVLLISTGVAFWQYLANGAQPAALIGVLDRLLLVLMIVELLYTVQVSFRTHAIVPDPFLIVSLVAVTRRILVVTAEFSNLQEKGVEIFRMAMIELAVLTAMVIGLVASLMMLRRRGEKLVAAERA